MITENLIATVREARALNFPLKTVARFYGMSESWVSRIANWQRRAPHKSPKSILSDDVVLQAYHLRRYGLPRHYVAKLYNLHPTTISHITSGDYRKTLQLPPLHSRKVNMKELNIDDAVLREIAQPAKAAADKLTDSVNKSLEAISQLRVSVYLYALQKYAETYDPPAHKTLFTAYTMAVDALEPDIRAQHDNLLKLDVVENVYVMLVRAFDLYAKK
jgi:hypothetical protein